ncbi:MAG TPA: hypothetical protein VNQ79_06785 [Blastocatellia bacterium]|nr:hypothetical protein [Blastocatellia bacterium]
MIAAVFDYCATHPLALLAAMILSGIAAAVTGAGLAQLAISIEERLRQR